MLEDLLELYTAAAAGRPSQLAPLTVQIADFAAAQRSWVASGLFDRQLAFWRERLMGSPALLPLPTDYSRPAEPSYRGDSVRFRLDEALVRLAKQCGRAEGMTFSMTMLAAFAAQLGLLSGEGDICIGSGMANRRTPESGSMKGSVPKNGNLETPEPPDA